MSILIYAIELMPGRIGLVETLLARPVASVTPDDFLHTAIARMESRGVRHLAVVARGSGQALGILVAFFLVCGMYVRFCERL